MLCCSCWQNAHCYLTNVCVVYPLALLLFTYVVPLVVVVYLVPPSTMADPLTHEGPSGEDEPGGDLW